MNESEEPESPEKAAGPETPDGSGGKREFDWEEEKVECQMSKVVDILDEEDESS